MTKMDENPCKAPQSTFTLTCCHCWKQFEIYGEQAERTRWFYDSQPDHTPDKEVGVCDECWAKCTKAEKRVHALYTLVALPLAVACAAVAVAARAPVRAVESWYMVSSAWA